MNHLAHALLADGRGDAFALGSAVGDFVHGRPDPAWPAAQQAGLRFHRSIDRYTDSHPAVVAARREFDPPLRRYAGIALDIWFDHLLARDWQRLAPLCGHAESLDDFTQRWLALLDAHATELPGGLRRFLAYMDAHGLPAAYADTTMIDEVLHGVAARLSRPSPLGDMLPALSAHAAGLQRHFEAFYPDLVAFARGVRVTSPARPSTPPSP